MVLLLRVEARPKLFPYTTLFRSGFRTRTSANLPGTTGTIETVIRGLDTTGGVDNLDLTMTGPAASAPSGEDRKSTRLNSNHVRSSYAGCCLTKIHSM